MRRAHWIPIARDPTQALTWKNLYGSCHTKRTCDRLQDDSDLGLRWPCDVNYVSFLRYTTSGALRIDDASAGGLAPEEQEGLRRALFERTEHPRSVATLNLNAPFLIAARVAALDALRKELRRRPQDRETLALELLSRPRRPEYVSIMVAWLRRELVPHDA